MSWNNRKVSEPVLVLCGATLLLSLPIILFTEGFFVWVVAKILYGVGVTLFVFNK